MKILLKLAIFLVLCAESYANPPSVMLLKNFDKNLLPSDFPNDYVVSEKLDGIRAFWNGSELKTRNGEKINIPQCLKAELPPFSIDGELWSKRDDFEQIQSRILKMIKGKSSECADLGEIKYHIFDVPSEDSTLLERLDILERYLQNAPKHPNKRIVIIKQEKIKSLDWLMEKLESVSSKGGEGLVVRKNSVGYERFRTSNALKLKKLNDSECEIVGYTQGKGKFSNKVGAIICQENGKTFKIGSGLSDKFRSTPPKIGTKITYKFNGYTKNGNPRFPVFVRIHAEM